MNLPEDLVLSDVNVSYHNVFLSDQNVLTITKKPLYGLFLHECDGILIDTFIRASFDREKLYDYAKAQDDYMITGTPEGHSSLKGCQEHYYIELLEQL